MRGLLDPKVDFVFKNIFGSPKHPKILISFLNAALKPINKIKSVEIKGTDLEKQFIDDKYSRLDVRATTNNNEIINIEIQLKNEYNMVQRSLYYLSKMYEEQLGEGENYSKLNRTVCINKLSKDSDEKDMLMAWTEFLRDPESEKVRSLEMSIEEIREAKDELVRMSNDKEQREIYEMRAKILKDKVSALNEAERKGIEKGLQQGEKNKAIEIAKNLLDVLNDETISLKTGLTIEEITRLRQES